MSVSARLTLTVEVESGSLWSNKESVDHIKEKTIIETIDKLTNLLLNNRVKIVSPIKASSIHMYSVLE